MRMTPTKNLAAAIDRLKKAAYYEGLICRKDFKYGGSIARDIVAVFF